MVIGGFAVIAHDYVRATEDVDLLIPADGANDDRLKTALETLGAVWADGGGALESRELTGRAHSRLPSTSPRWRLGPSGPSWAPASSWSPA